MVILHPEQASEAYIRTGPHLSQISNKALQFAVYDKDLGNMSIEFRRNCIIYTVNDEEIWRLYTST